MRKPLVLRQSLLVSLLSQREDLSSITSRLSFTHLSLQEGNRVFLGGQRNDLAETFYFRKEKCVSGTVDLQQ